MHVYRYLVLHGKHAHAINNVHNNICIVEKLNLIL